VTADAQRGRLELSPGQPLRAGLVAALREILDYGEQQVERSRTNPTEAVHEHRKALRRARSLIRITRPFVSKTASRKLDVALKQAHRSQSDLRDAEILAHALSMTGAPSESGEVGAALEAHRRRELDAARIRVVLRASAESTRDIPDRLGIALPEEVDLSDLMRGLRRSYRRARNELQRVQAVPDPIHIHNWRKRNKDVVYQLELLVPHLGKRAEKARSRYAKLSQRLGEITDLFVLRRFIDSLPDAVPERADLLKRLTVLAAIKIRRALIRGESLFAEPPRKMIAHLR
jgi:CHAD domain-containing protein